jgi:hypothetical protein
LAKAHQIVHPSQQSSSKSLLADGEMKDSSLFPDEGQIATVGVEFTRKYPIRRAPSVTRRKQVPSGGRDLLQCPPETQAETITVQSTFTCKSSK